MHPRVAPYKFLVPVIVPKARSTALIDQAFALKFRLLSIQFKSERFGGSRTISEMGIFATSLTTVGRVKGLDVIAFVVFGAQQAPVPTIVLSWLRLRKRYWRENRPAVLCRPQGPGSRPA